MLRVQRFNKIDLCAFEFYRIYFIVEYASYLNESEHTVKIPNLSLKTPEDKRPIYLEQE